MNPYDLKKQTTCQKQPDHGKLDMEEEQNEQSLDSAFYQTANTFFSNQAGTALTYDDLTLSTLYSEVLPRNALLDTELAGGLNPVSYTHLTLPTIA